MKRLVLYLMLASLPLKAMQEDKNMAVYLQGGVSPLPLLPLLSLNAQTRFEYALSPAWSLIFPLEYRFSLLLKTHTYDTMTAGFGPRFYFSQLFWAQNLLSGFYAEVFAGIGYVHEQSDIQYGGYYKENISKNHGAVFSLAGGLGYSHALAVGLCLGLSANMAARKFTNPIREQSILPISPEVLAHVGWKF